MLPKSPLREALRIKPRSSAPSGLRWLDFKRIVVTSTCLADRLIAALELRPKFADAFCVLANNLQGRLPDAEIQAMRAANRAEVSR